MFSAILPRFSWFSRGLANVFAKIWEKITKIVEILLTNHEIRGILQLFEGETRKRKTQKGKKMNEQIAKLLAAVNDSPLALYLAGVAAGIEIQNLVAAPKPQDAPQK